MIHSTAVVDPAARLAEGVQVGPYSVIGAEVEIGAGTSIGPHVVIQGPVRLGEDNAVHAFASLGGAPQDTGYGGEPTRLEIGDRNVIREYSTFSRGTVSGHGVTRIGNDNFFMAYTHVAHDCVVEDNTVFANAASLAGHVLVEEFAILSGFAIVHQFCRIGAHSFCAMGSVISKDVPPYAMVAGNPASPHGINTKGLRRRGFSADTVQRLRAAHKVIYKSHRTLASAIEELRRLGTECPEVMRIAEFLNTSKRSIVR